MNKRRLAVGCVVLCLVITSLAGCGGNKKSSDKAEGSSVVAPTTTSQATDAPDDVTDGEKSDTAIKSLANIIDDARTREETEVYKAITDKSSEEYAEAIKVLGVDADTVEDSAIAIDTSEDKAYAVAVFKVKDTAAEMNVLGNLTMYVMAKRESLGSTDYKAVTEEAMVESVGDKYIVLAMCKNANAVFNQIKDNIESFENPESESIEVNMGADVVTDETEAPKDAPISNIIVSDTTNTSVETPVPVESTENISSVQTTQSNDGWR